MKLMFRLSLTMLLAALLVLPGLAQSSTGSVRGTVRDVTKGVLPGAEVVLTSIATNVTLQTLTNDEGIYVFPSVKPGIYRLTVDTPGMQKWEATLTVQVQQSAVIDVEMKVGETTTEVTVQDVTPLLTVDNSALGHVLERQRIEQLPINGRQVTNLLNTVPGLEGLRAYGMRTGNNEIVLDGAPLTDALYAGAPQRQPSLDTIHEFKVENNASSAKFARQTNVILTTKSGTNEFHGTLFETHRNNAFGKARTRTDLPATPGGKYKAPQMIQNEYGGTVGGPVRLPWLYNGKDKTFFFVAYEEMKRRQSTTGLWRVPTEAMRNGDYSGLINSMGQLSKIYDPWTTDPQTWQRQQFTYQGRANVIDPSRISPLAKYMYSVLPLPNNNNNPLLDANYVGLNPNETNQWTTTVRVDHSISPADQIYGRYTAGRHRLDQQSSSIMTLDRIANFTHRDYPNKSIVLGWNHTLSTSFFNELVVSGSRERGYVGSGEPGVDYAAKLGTPNPLHTPGFPVINDIGFGSNGSNYFMPSSMRDKFFNYFVLDDNATKIVGRHELQFGVHLRANQNTILPQQQQSAGFVSFATNATSLYDPNSPRTAPLATNLTGHLAANAFLGVANYSYRATKGIYYIRQKEYAFYFQDNLKLTPKLTLNLGLRYQLSPFPGEKYNVLSSFDRKNKAFVLGRPLEELYQANLLIPSVVDRMVQMGAKFETYQEAGLPKKLVKDNWHDIGPHLGFAYSAFNGAKAFVIRGGFSVSYFPIPMYQWNDQMRRNAPFAGNFQNYLTSAATSPDGIAQWGMRSVPTIIAGYNSTDAISLNNPLSMARGSEAFFMAYWNPDQPTPRVYDWNLTLEKEIFNDSMIRAAYVGYHASKQESLEDYNNYAGDYIWYMTTKEPIPNRGEYNDVFRRPYENTVLGILQEYRTDGFGNFNGAQLEFEKRYSKGYAFHVFYNLGNVFRAGGDGYNQSVPGAHEFMPGLVPTDYVERLRFLSYRRDTSIPKHRIRWNWIADLPFGRGQWLAGDAKGWLNHIIGGWQLSGMGTIRSTYFSLPTSIWPTGEDVEIYGKKYPIQDCRSGNCYDGYLWFNGYIPANQVNSVDANGKPNGVMGVPSNYKPAAQPLNPWPVNPDPKNPAYKDYGTNNVYITLNDGTTRRIGYAPGYHPWQGTPMPSVWQGGVDASFFKSFPIKEDVKVRLNVDFSNIFNQPGLNNSVGNDGILSRRYSANAARETQISLRLIW